MTSFFILLQYLVPQHLFTRFIALFAESRFPPWKNLMIRVFIRSYGVDMGEALEPEPSAYPNFNAFFTRALKPGARPLEESGNGLALLSPADGTVSAIGRIEAGRVYQAKGHDFSLAALLGSEVSAELFRDGLFATIYLSPKDYHRVHMPFAGRLLETTFIPGKLFSVNQVTAERIPALFARNERLVCLFETAFGPMAVVLVGAMIVGSMETVWEGEALRGSQVRVTHYRNTEAAPALEKGAELGRFKLGSTAIVLLPAGVAAWSERHRAGSQINMGSMLGVLTEGVVAEAQPPAAD